MEDLRIELSPGSRDVFEFQTAVRHDSAPLTVIDLSQVPYMDSAALGSILGFHASCHLCGFAGLVRHRVGSRTQLNLGK